MQLQKSRSAHNLVLVALGNSYLADRTRAQREQLGQGDEKQLCPRMRSLRHVHRADIP